VFVVVVFVITLYALSLALKAHLMREWIYNWPTFNRSNVLSM